MKKLTIYLDFDGTVVEHMYPKIGRCNFGCMEVIKKLQDAGHHIILNTMRVEFRDGSLEEAIEYLQGSWRFFKDRNSGDELREISQWTLEKIHPHPFDIDTAIERGELYIDDIATGIPLKSAAMTGGNMVDWDQLDSIFWEKGIYNL